MLHWNFESLSRSTLSASSVGGVMEWTRNTGGVSYLVHFVHRVHCIHHSLTRLCLLLHCLRPRSGSPERSARIWRQRKAN